MSEIIDLYDNARRFVTTAKRRAPIPDGLNKLSVHVWFVNSRGQFLLQQRLPTSKKFPNMWGQTGGGAIAGESGWDCCVRESTEEIGITPQLENSVWVGTFKRPHGFVDVWMVTQDVDLSDIKMQPDEVQNVMWASADKIKDMLAAGEFIPSIMTGFNMVCDYIEMLRH